MDTILRNARIKDEPFDELTDIGIEEGRIAAIESNLNAEGQEFDLGGRLVSSGFIESHIHLDKSRILDRCKSEKGDLDEAIEEVAKAKRSLRRGTSTIEHESWATLPWKRFQDNPEFEQWLKTSESAEWDTKVGAQAVSNFRASWKRNVTKDT